MSVKIRSDDEIDEYNQQIFDQEKRSMEVVDGFTIVDLIKTSIEALMNMKAEDSRDPTSEKANNRYQFTPPRDIDEPSLEIDLPA